MHVDATGIVSSIAAPLARDGFSVLYISMFNSDLILVEEDQLAAALASVEQALHKLRDQSPSTLLPDVANLVLATSLPPRKKAPVSLTSVEFSVVSAKLQLGWLHQRDLKRSCYSLMRLFLNPSAQDRFLSFTIAADEISIVVAEEDFTELKSEDTGIAFHPESWCAMEASVRNPKISAYFCESGNTAVH